MWSAILGIIDKLLGYFKNKQDRSNKEFEIKQTEEFKKVEKAQEQAARTDENEKLVNTINSGTKEESDAALEELRKRLGE